MSDREAEDALTQQLVETGKREELKEKVSTVEMAVNHMIE
jgi:hypothetical protein